MNKTAHVKYSGNMIYINTPYDPEFVSKLKSTLKTRKWDPAKKEWVVDIRERDAALNLLKQYYDIFEDNQPPEIPQAPGSVQMGSLNKLLQTDLSPEWLSGEGLEIWTDGACHGNPGPGGYGIIFKHHGERLARSGGFRLTTNNRMEIMAAIVALEMLTEKTSVVVCSDSQYLVNAITQGWARRWKADGWKRNKKDRAINPDLWDRLLDLCDKHKVEFRWIRGHDSQVDNEWCDQLAVAAAGQPDLPDDPGYPGENTSSAVSSAFSNTEQRLL
jgi:ribonuclease HI